MQNQLHNYLERSQIAASVHSADTTLNATLSSLCLSVKLEGWQLLLLLPVIPTDCTVGPQGTDSLPFSFLVWFFLPSLLYSPLS